MGLAHTDSPRAALCPRCGYDTYGCRHPVRCPECGLAIADGLLDGLIPWERLGTVSALVRCARTIVEALLKPRIYYGRLGRRAQTPVFRSTNLIAAWLGTAGAIMVVSAVVLMGYHIVDSAYFQGYLTLQKVVAREVRWIGWTFRFFGTVAIGPWAVCWVLVAATLAATAGRSRKVFGFRSALCVFGPVMLISQFLACVLMLADSLISLTSPVKPITPYAVLALLVCLILLWGLHIIWSLTRVRPLQQARPCRFG